MSVFDEDHLIGGIGFVSTRIGGRQVAGEVQLRLHGGSESFIAYADEPIERGRQVMVVNRRPGRVVEVTVFDG